MGSMSAVEYGAAPLHMGLTRDFARFAADLTFDDLPKAVVHEARRGVLDWLGCAIAGSRHATIATLLTGLSPIGSLERVPVIGRGMRLGVLEAAIVNGQMGHVLDFDDTHMDGVVLHTSSPALAAILSAAEVRPVDGRRLVLAYALAFEAGVRAGKAAPDHHDGGWHLTGTLGSIAAGCGTASLIGLDADRMVHAIGVAATQGAGMQQNRGTMSKSFHAGKAAANGALAAFLAREGFDSSDEIIEGRKGFSRIFSKRADPEAMVRDLGSTWAILLNGHKPYACGVVLHPVIDAMIALNADVASPADVRSVAVRVHPQAVRITGVADPRSGLQSKFSLVHAVAVSLIDARAGREQFDTERALAADVTALRSRVDVVADEGLRIGEAHATVVDKAGARHDAHVDYASGTRENPMSDGAIEEKFFANAVPVIGRDRADALRELIWRLEALLDVRDILKGAA